MNRANPNTSLINKIDDDDGEYLLLTDPNAVNHKSKFCLAVFMCLSICVPIGIPMYIQDDYYQLAWYGYICIFLAWIIVGLGFYYCFGKAPIAYYIKHEQDSDNLIFLPLTRRYGYGTNTYIGKLSNFLYCELEQVDVYVSRNNGPATYSRSIAKLVFYFNDSQLPFKLEQPFQYNDARLIVQKINDKWATQQPPQVAIIVAQGAAPAAASGAEGY